MLDQGTQTDVRTLAAHSSKRYRGTAPYPISHAPTRAATLWARTIELIWPWRMHQYEGYSTEAAKALGITPKTAFRWLFHGARPVKPENADKIAALCLSRGRALIQLGEAWERYSSDRSAEIKANKKNPPACPPGGFLTSKKR